MIIVEGPDGAGKTTLIEYLSKTTGTPQAPRAVSSDAVAQLDIRSYVETQLSQGFRNLLFDRFALISGPIYGAQTGMAHPNEVFADLDWVIDMERQFLLSRALVVYCLPPLEEVKYNLGKDRASQAVVGSYHNLEVIYWSYRARAALDVARGVGEVYDYTKPGALAKVLGGEVVDDA